MQKLQQQRQAEKGNTMLQTRTVSQIRSTNQYRTTNIESPSSEKEVLQKSRNEAGTLRDGDRERKALLAAQSSNLAQKLAYFQKNVAIIRRSRPHYLSKLSFSIE